ncbi:alpha/beta fold hydrolase [Legionella sp.]|uniref:alpha/beta fold hydrolase n=1 Tax=Legionella sp. TaxID=459 RepID=UPI003CBFDE7C
MTKQSLILLPGLMSDKTIWQHQYQHLQNIANIKIVELNEDSSEKMVTNVLDHAPKQFALAGHSMGGWLALEIMKTVPNRVTKLCLLNTTARNDSLEKHSHRKCMIEAVNNGQFLQIANKIATNFVYNQMIKKDVLNMFLRVGKQVFINQQTAMINRDECISILPNITCPTLVIHAQKDNNFSIEMHEELAHNILNAKLELVKDSGHMSPMEKPQAVTALMRYWLECF